MKRLLGLGAAIAATFLCVVAAASAQPPGQDSVTGFGLLNFFPFNSGWESVSVDARSGPSGQDPSGDTFYDVCGPATPTRSCYRGGPVTCLNVTGNRAVFGWFGPLIAATALVRYRGLMEIVDNGSPGAGRDTIQIAEDLIVFSSTPYDPALDVPITQCPASLPGEGRPLFAGDTSPYVFDQDYVVTDAQPPLPTSKDQCKKGGWRTYGIFKNQGDCVSFVATGGKNSQAGTKKP